MLCCTAGRSGPVAERALAVRRRDSLLQHHLAEAQGLLRRSLAVSSATQYSTSWRRWVAFVDAVLATPDYLLHELPVMDVVHRLMAFASYLHHSLGFSATTADATLTGLRHEFRCRLADTAAFEHPLLLQVRRALRRTPSTRRRGPRLPFTLEMVQHFLQFARQTSRREHWMNAVGALLGFFGLFRASEYCVAPNSDHTFRAAAVEFEVPLSHGVTHMVPAHQSATLHLREVSAVRITLHSAKNLRDGNGIAVWFSRLPRDSHQICLVHELLRWARTAEYSNATDYFLSIRRPNLPRLPLTYTTFQAAVKAVGRVFHLDPTRCGSHSLRIGGATCLHAAGASSATLQQAGRWRSLPVAAAYAQRSSQANDAQLQMLQSQRGPTTRDIRLATCLPSRPRPPSPSRRSGSGLRPV